MHELRVQEGQSVGVEGPGDIENDVKSSQSKTDTKTTSDQHSEQHQDDDDDDDAGRTRDVKHIPNAQQLNPESVPSCSGQADSLPTTTAPAQEEHGDSVPAELPSGTAEPAEQPCASSNDNNPQVGKSGYPSTFHLLASVVSLVLAGLDNVPMNTCTRLKCGNQESVLMSLCDEPYHIASCTACLRQYPLCNHVTTICRDGALHDFFCLGIGMSDVADDACCRV